MTEATILSQEDCWELLSAHEFGRLAFAVAGEPDIAPINYVAQGGKLYFRTAAGSKLLGVTINHKVAFEVDEITADSASSVILCGTIRELETAAERESFEALPLRPWVDTEKYHYLELEPREVSGRRFPLGGRGED